MKDVQNLPIMSEKMPGMVMSEIISKCPKNVRNK
mgnify:CR=1 FL=1